MLTHRVKSSSEEVGRKNAWKLHGILERKEKPLTSTNFWIELKQILVLEGNRTLGDVVPLFSTKDICEGALTRTVHSHDGVNLTWLDLKVNSLEDLSPLTFYAGMQI
jgi:hypothetical protein